MGVGGPLHTAFRITRTLILDTENALIQFVRSIKNELMNVLHKEIFEKNKITPSKLWAPTFEQ